MPPMILSDRDLRARLKAGDLVVEELEDEQIQIQPASIDLRLDSEFMVYRRRAVICLDPQQPETLQRAVDLVRVERGEAFVLHPGAFALGSTSERVKIPADLVAQVNGRSSIGRLGVIVHATAGFVDPGFEGQITLELSNVGPLPVRLYPGMRIAQIVLCRMSSAAEIPYGEARGSSYQGQQGPLMSRVRLDR